MNILILSPGFKEFNYGFSLTGIIIDQCTMLSRNGHTSYVAVDTAFHGDIPNNVNVCYLLEHTDQIDYHDSNDLSVEHKNIAVITSEKIKSFVIEKKIDLVFTHDIILTGWQLPYYHAIRIASEDLDVGWLHWVHSVPLHNYNWWNINDTSGVHSIVFPNRASRQLVAEAFKTEFGNVSIIPHIKDIRVVGRFKPETWEFIDKYPELLSADVVQVYPASSDRLSMKRLREVMLIFKGIKELGFSVCLLCANQWATGKQPREDIAEYEDMALRNGLSKREFIFSSESDKKYELGLPHDMLMDLLSLGNVFIFPTYSESFGLVLPEAILASGAMPVINSHLDVLNEMLDFRGLRFGFGSYTSKLNYPRGGEKRYLSDIAKVITARMGNEESIAARTLFRKKFNMDYLYKQYYLPIMTEMSETAKGGENGY